MQTRRGNPKKVGFNNLDYNLRTPSNLLSSLRNWNENRKLTIGKEIKKEGGKRRTLDDEEEKEDMAVVETFESILFIEENRERD